MGGRQASNAKSFGDDVWNRRMRAARQQADMSADDVAKTMGVSASAIRNWEAGHKFPSRENLQEFAAATNVDMVWLLTGFSEDELALAEKAGRATAAGAVPPF
jgi:transcriptional regulator with XRE-family HTH domain